MKEREPVKACPPSIHLERQEEEKKPKRIPISRSEFLWTIDEEIDMWKGKALDANLNIHRLEGLKEKLFRAEELDLKIDYYILGKRTYFEAREKGKFGFRGSVENNEPAQEQ